MEGKAKGNEFAKNELAKYGWKEGKGLGKNEDGIAKPVQASLKFDKTGVGYDPGEDFSFQWWDHVFNSAARSIVVENSQKGVEVKAIRSTAFEVSTKKPFKKPRKLQYGTFVKTGMLNDGKMEHKQIDVADDFKDIRNDLSSRLSAEEIFKACGSCTAHKAARHGHKLNGKLQRLKEQERKHLEWQEACKPELVKKKSSKSTTQEIKKLKRHKSNSKQINCNEILTELPKRKKKLQKT